MAVQSPAVGPWLLDALALVASLIAVVTDRRSQRIPNWLTGSTAALALLAWTAAALIAPEPGVRQLGWAVLGGASALLTFALLSWLGVLGFGDTKLVAAIGLCVGYPSSLRVIVCTVLCGGVIALVQALRLGRLGVVIANLRRARELARSRIDEPGHALHALPYAVAIACGTAWAIAARHLPEIAPL